MIGSRSDLRHIRTIELALLAALLVVVAPAKNVAQEISAEDAAAIEAGPVFTPMTLRPEIRNRAESQEALMQEYPAVLRDSGIGGRVVVWFFISPEGRVLDRRISETSGHNPLDESALRVADVFRFTPAMNRDEPVAVWIQLPITFQLN